MWPFWVTASLTGSADDRLAFYETMLRQYPRSHLVKRKTLMVATGEL